MTRLTTELFRTPGIVFDAKTGEEYDLTDILLVNKRGDVFRLPRQHENKMFDGKFVIGRPNKKGYYQVGIVDNNGKKRYPYVHRLVAHAWLHREPYQTDVMHKDDDPTNNNVNNIRWCTTQENIHDMMNKNRDKFFGRLKACSDDVMVHIWKLGRGGANMKPRHIYELFPDMSEDTLYSMLTGHSKRLQRYLKNNLVK